MSVSNNEFDKIDISSRLLNLILEMSMDDQLHLLNSLDKRSYEGTRRHSRKKIKNLWAVVIDEQNDNHSNDYIRDISPAGMYIETAKQFFIGQEIFLNFKFPNQEKVFNIFGEIIRIDKIGVGIKFTRKIQEADVKRKPGIPSRAIANS